jgi:signal peptidase I
MPREPLLVEYAKSFFPVILIVFALRSFLVEPFKIPSGSMMPTLLIGDFILVNKYTYGIRLPVINRKVVELNNPERGDVMVFRYPADPGLDYIKRVVGVPGDVVEYRDKQLSINGQPVPKRQYRHLQLCRQWPQLHHRHGVRRTPQRRRPQHDDRAGQAAVYPPQVVDFPYRENCSYNADGEGFVCKVPEGSIS